MTLSPEGYYAGVYCVLYAIKFTSSMSVKMQRTWYDQRTCSVKGGIYHSLIESILKLSSAYDDNKDAEYMCFGYKNL